MRTRDDYWIYLKGDHWRVLRLQVLDRDGHKCTRCPSRVRLQAHHTFYRARWEDAQISDLITLCRACHEKEHGISTPAPEPPRDYISQIYTIDQLKRARKLGFVTESQFQQLSTKFKRPEMPPWVLSKRKPYRKQISAKRRRKEMKIRAKYQPWAMRAFR